MSQTEWPVSSSELLSSNDQLHRQFQTMRSMYIQADEERQQLAAALQELKEERDQSVSTLTSRLRDIESQLRVGAEEFQQQVQATLLTAEDLAEVRIRYIEEIEQPLREEISDLRQRLAQEQDNVFVCKRQIDFFKSSMEAEREGHALELQRVLLPFEMREQELKSELVALQQALDDAYNTTKQLPDSQRRILELERKNESVVAEAAELRAQLEVAVVARETLGMELKDRVFEVSHSLSRKEAELENAERRYRLLERELNETMRCCERLQEREAACEMQGVQLRDAAAAAEAARELDVSRWKTRSQELVKELEEEVHANRQRVEHMSRSHEQQLKELQQTASQREAELLQRYEQCKKEASSSLWETNVRLQETSKQNSQLQDSVAEMQQRLREQESLYVSRLAALENERRRCEQQIRELEGAFERERSGQQELLAKHEAACSEAMEAEAALKAVREAATTADKQRHSTKAELEEMKERYRLTLSKVAELEDALQRERVDKVERLQMLQAEAESEIGRLTGDLQQLQMQTQDAGAKGKQIKDLSRRAIEKLDAALRDEKAAVRTLKSRAAEAEERERRLTESHAAELGVLQKRLRAAELRSKELQSLLERDDSATAPSPPSPRSADGDSGGGGGAVAAQVQLKPARKQLQALPLKL